MSDTQIPASSLAAAPAPVRHNSTLSTVQQQVAAALACGAPISVAARSARVHRATVHNWLKRDAAFRSAVQESREEHAAGIAANLREIAVNALDTIRCTAADPRTPPAVRLKAALALLDRTGFLKRQCEIVAAVEASTDLRGDNPRHTQCRCGAAGKCRKCRREQTAPTGRIG